MSAGIVPSYSCRFVSAISNSGANALNHVLCSFLKPAAVKANYNANPNKVVQMNVVLVYHKSIKASYQAVYKRVADMIRRHNATYQFGSKPFGVVEAGDMNQHWGAIERYFGGTKLPENLFGM